MVDVRRRKLAIIAMNVSVLAAALSWLLVVFSLIYSADAVPWAFGVAIVLSVIGVCRIPLLLRVFACTPG